LIIPNAGIRKLNNYDNNAMAELEKASRKTHNNPAHNSHEKGCLPTAIILFVDRVAWVVSCKSGGGFKSIFKYIDRVQWRRRNSVETRYGKPPFVKIL
jgi:hypothetical protein